MASSGAIRAGQAYIERTLGDRPDRGLADDGRRRRVFVESVRIVGRRITAVSAAMAAAGAAIGPLGRGNQT